MVRPVTSKRKLFNNNKDQFKENEPDQIITSDSETFVNSKTHSLASCLFTNNSLNSSKTSPAESSSKSERRRESLSCGDWQRRCEAEDGGTTFTTGRTAMPMSERQQIALLMQLSSPSPPTNKSDRNSLNSPQTPTTPHFGRGIAKRNERGETPLHVAAIKGDCEKVAQLISQGASVNATDYAGWTALHEACNRGFLVIASLLIKGGADVNANGLDNDTPLHDACVNNHYQIVRLLLRSGAKTNSTNCRGKTPFDVCRSPRILTLLEEAKSGSLTLDSTEKDLSRIKIQDFDRSQFEREYSLSNKGTSPDLCQTLGMSRKTPPNNNKMDEKPVVPSSVPSSVTSNTGGGSQSGNGTSLGGNARPVSPRVTLRLPHVPRTPEKSQQRSHETKNTSENEDVYEFRCTKEESKEGENEEKSDGGSVKPPEVSSSDPKGDKRPRENDPESDDEVKKRRRKEECKEIAKTMGRGGGGGGVGQGRPSSSDKGMKLGPRTSSSNGNSSGKQSSSSSTATTSTPSSTSTSSSVTSTITSTSTISCTGNSDHRKSPSTVSSPKPPSGNSKASPEKMDSDSDDTKNETNSGAPKVPPLKIVLAPCGLSEQETSSINGKNGSNRQLPYVVNSSSGSTEDKEPTSIETKDLNPPIKEEPNIGSNSTSGAVSTLTVNTTNSSTTTLPVSTFGNATITSLSSSNCSSTHMIASTTSASDKASATRITRSQRGGGSGSGSSSNYGDEPITIKTEPKTEDQMTTDVVHPRKRKIKMKEPEMEQVLPAAVPEQPVATNCYEMFLKIRKQVERRRKLLFPVQPKPPQGFKDYLMNRCSYVLANNSNSQLSVPVIPAPASLSQALKDLFNEQEQERYKLRLQQLIEKEKLVLSVEQEILRVHGRAARALANQVLPFSVCTILKDEEVYNVISPEQEEKDRNARSRYNGRLFLSWLQDVDDKWEKIKEAMVLRHHNEAESLHAVQKMDWEWKLKENGLIEPNSKTQIDELHVPMVQVADFDLLPA